MIKYFLLIISILLTLILLAIGGLLLFEEPYQAESKLFCAYNRVFVEFEDGKYKWGALLLDEDGKPISCNAIQNTDNTKGYM
jgi:hypothetical protein